MHRIIYRPSFLKRLRNAEHFHLFDSIILYIQEKDEIKPPGLVPVCNDFIRTFGTENKLYKKAVGKEETVLIMEAHRKRKKSYMALKYSVKAAYYSDTASLRSAAGSILEVMRNYSRACYAPLTEASALITNLIEDLEEANRAAKVALIAGAEEAIASLKLHNDTFIARYAGRTLIQEEEKMDGNMQEARILTDQMFDVLADSINAFYRANEMLPAKDAEAGALLYDLILFINSYLRRHETILARRKAANSEQ
jgi:hypothetical protein